MSRITFTYVRDRMAGQWRPCLEALGIPPTTFKRGGQPCIFCGGTDRANFGSRNHPEVYYCRQCKPRGFDGFGMLQQWHRWTAVETLQAVAGWLGVPTYSNVISFPKAPKNATVAAAKQPATPPEKILTRICQLWTEATPLSAAEKAVVAHKYFNSRGLVGLPRMPANVRFHSLMAYWWRDPNGEPVKLGVYPALLALVRTVDRKVTGLHRTYLQPDGSDKLAITSPDGEPLPAKKLLSISDRSTYGCAVPTYPIGSDGVLAIAEGLETALAITALWNIVCWPCLSEGGIKRFQLPAGVQELIICCDNDISGIGQAAGKALARRLLAQPNAPVVKLMIPDDTGTDWLDYLNATRQGVCHG